MHVVVLQFDEDPVRPEPADEAVERHGRLGAPSRLHEAGDAALSAAAEHDQPVRVPLQIGERQHGVEPPLLLRTAIGLAQPEGVAGEPAEVGVALPRLRQQREVRAHLAAVAVVVAFRRRLGDGQFEAADRPQSGLAGSACELHRPEHAVVVGQRQRRVTLLDGGPHQLAGARGALQQRVVAVHVQLDVGHTVERVAGEGRGSIAGRTRARGVRHGPSLPGLELVPALHVAGLLIAACTRHGVTPSPHRGMVAERAFCYHRRPMPLARGPALNIHTGSAFWRGSHAASATFPHGR